MTTKAFSIKIGGADAKKRIDAHLASIFPDHSRNYFQTLIANGGIFVNGKSVKKDYRVRVGDDVAIRFAATEEVDLSPDSAVPFFVVRDENDFAVVEKPAGVVVHPSHTHKKGTLVNGLLARWPQIKGVGDPSTDSGQENLRPGIVHRLDKETSGLMVIAKTQPMFVWLKKQFKEGLVSKRYYALVVGRLREKEGVISAPIGRIGTKQAVIIPLHKGFSGKAYKSRNATTGFKVSAFYKGFTLVEAQPKTGRMHQIRVHFKHLGHPVAGDKKYASRKQQKSL
ncbi:RluA family pseudouridine synthase, partial [Candidatus Azambacteria bacterium]|nr:RluA family pseudouridine synthase [Candidatus Azambacteria bacterium]